MTGKTRTSKHPPVGKLYETSLTTTLQTYIGACVGLSVLAMDDLEWTQVIDYCTQLLETEPNNIRALLERAQVSQPSREK